MARNREKIWPANLAGEINFSLPFSFLNGQNSQVSNVHERYTMYLATANFAVISKI